MTEIESVVILAPCYNEGEGIVAFLHSIEGVCRDLLNEFEIVIVNDGSTDRTAKLLDQFEFSAPNISLTILELNFNSGHQEAIFQGLLYSKTTKAKKFVVLDSDGQDDVSLIPEMIQLEDCDIVHVLRRKRSESLFFRFCYSIYKLIFKLITRKSIHFGNYCLINRRVLESAAHKRFVHFPAFLSTFVNHKKYLISDRQKRGAGKSKMRFFDLLNHAIKSFIQYSERLLMLCLWLFTLLAVTLVIFAIYVLYEKLFTDRAILGWASTIILGLFNGALITLSTFVIGTQLLKNAHQRNIKFTANVVRKEGERSLVNES